VFQFRKKLKQIKLSAEEQAARGIYDGFVQEFITLPYIMDLESTNGTLLNGDKIEGAKYYELRNKDLITFGLSKKSYVFMKL